MEYNKIAYAAGGAVLSFFAPLYTLIFWMFAFVAADLITGLWVARKKGLIWESAKLRNTVSKIFLYAMTIVLLHAMHTQMIPFEQFSLAGIGAALICGVELYSVFENAYEITGNRVFYILTQFTSRKLKDASGVDIGQDNGLN
jgi:hypothetical protein